MNLGALVDAIARLEPKQVLVARALDPALRAELAEQIEFGELPFVRGRTVVPEGLTEVDVVVAGNPNFLGIFDRPDTPTWVPVASGPTADAPKAIELAKHLAQLPGVTIPFRPESPVVVALFPIDPASLGLTPLSAYPELPGGARVEVESAVDANQYAAELRRRLDELGEEMENRWRQPPAP